jgi:hypothetical protein
VSRRLWRCSRSMRFGLRIERKIESDRQRQELPRRSFQRDHRCRRWWNGRQQRQAAEAARRAAIPVIAPRRRLPEQRPLADDDVRSGGVRDRGANGAKARDQARQRDRVSGRQRDHALCQWPLGETLSHEPSPVPTNPTEGRDILAARKFPGQSGRHRLGRGQKAATERAE